MKHAAVLLCTGIGVLGLALANSSTGAVVNSVPVATPVTKPGDMESEVTTKVFVAPSTSNPSQDVGTSLRFEAAPGTVGTATIAPAGAGEKQWVAYSATSSGQAAVGVLRQKTRAEASGRNGPIWELLHGWVWIYGWYPIVQTNEAIAASNGSGIMFERDAASGVNRIGAVESEVTVKRLNPNGTVHSTITIPAGQVWDVPHNPTEVPGQPQQIGALGRGGQPEGFRRSSANLVHDVGQAIRAAGKRVPW